MLFSAPSVHVPVVSIITELAGLAQGAGVAAVTNVFDVLSKSTFFSVVAIRELLFLIVEWVSGVLSHRRRPVDRATDIFLVWVQSSPQHTFII